jgi:F0F1-type ATP synthase assembly protein I
MRKSDSRSRMNSGDSGDLGKYLNLALLLPISALVGFLLGYGLDALFHTVWIRYVFLVLGVVSGFVEAFRVLTKDT